MAETGASEQRDPWECRPEWLPPMGWQYEVARLEAAGKTAFAEEVRRAMETLRDPE